MTFLRKKFRQATLLWVLKTLDRIGFAILMAILSYGGNQIRYLYQSVNELNKNFAVTVAIISEHGNQLKSLDNRVRDLEKN